MMVHATRLKFHERINAPCSISHAGYSRICLLVCQAGERTLNRQLILHNERKYEQLFMVSACCRTEVCDIFDKPQPYCFCRLTHVRLNLTVSALHILSSDPHQPLHLAPTKLIITNLSPLNVFHVSV